MKRKENLEKRRKFYILAILLMVLLITSFIAVVKLSNGEFKPGILNFNSAEDKEVEEENINSEEQESDSKKTTTNLVSSLTSSKTGIFSLSNTSKTTLSSPELTEGEGTNAATTNLTASVSMESIVQGFRDRNLADGDYEVVVNGETYKVELINYYNDVHYTTDTPSEELQLGDNKTYDTDGDDAYRTLVVKYHKNLTIDKGVTVSARSVNNLTYKKGMYICVLGELVNKGTITMTARGTYNCPGQDIYLWKDDNGNYEKVPADGGKGGASVSYTNTSKKGEEHNLQGNKGSGSTRQTGGGGSGGLCSARDNYSEYTATSGAGSRGTSYSGGSGGGGITMNYNGTQSAQNGEIYGGAGGKAFVARTKSTWEARGAGGGAGNTGGDGMYTTGKDPGGESTRNLSDYKSYNGENGTGGLLIIYSQEFTNIGEISSNGSKGGDGTRAGGG